MSISSYEKENASVPQADPNALPPLDATEAAPQAGPPSLRVNFSWTLAGNLVYAACHWGMLTAIAKLGTPEMVGQFALGLALTAPVIMFANLQLRGVQATDARRLYRFNDYLALRLVTTVLAFMAIAAIALLGGYRPGTAAAILAVGLSKSFEAISDIFFGLLQQHEQMDRIAKRMMIKGFLALVMLAAALLLTGDIVAAAAGLLAANAISLFALDIRGAVSILGDPARRGRLRHALDVLRPRWSLRTMAALAWLALPLGFAMMLISLNANIPRYVLERALGERELGIFAAMAYVVVGGTTVVGALGQSMSPRLAKYYACGDAGAYGRLLLKSLGIGAALGVAGVLVALFAGRPLLALLYRPEYAERADVFAWIMVAAGVGYVASFLGYGMTAARRFRVQLPLFLAATGAVTLASLALIPAEGLRGAALALLAGNGVQMAGSACVVLYALWRARRAQGEGA